MSSNREVHKEASTNANAPTQADTFGDYRIPGLSKMTRANADAAKIVAVAEDQLNPWRSPFMSSRDYPGLQPMTKSIDDEMAKLNRDPKRMDAAINRMEHQAEAYNKRNNTDMHVKVTKDEKGNRDVTFDVPMTEHYIGEAHRFQVLNAKDEANVLKLASNLKALPEPLSFPSLRSVANITKSYDGHEHSLDRMLTNLSVEAGRRQVGLGTFGTGHDAALTAYGATSPTYFHSDGRITRNDLK